MSDSAPDPRRRWRDFWQLHLPLVVVLAFCTFATVVEARRASEGVWRAWAYMVEWPLIGLFAIWIWNRYRRHGTVFRGLGDRWRAHFATYGAAEESAAAAPPSPTLQPDDPDLDAWREYVDELHRREPPGSPPAG